MHVSHRSYLTAGIAVFGAAAVALTPITPGAGTSPATRTSDIAVQLASSIDPITPWVNTIVGAIDNIGGLAQAALANPFPIASQVISNQVTYFGELPDIGLILSQIVGNVSNAVMAPFGESPLLINPTTSGETTGLIAGPLDHFTFYFLTVSEGNIGLLTPAQIAQIKPIFDAMTIPATGVALGLVGPLIAPVLALGDSVGNIVSALGQADIIGAINELINIPANLVNAVLNGGQFLDLAPLAGLLGLELPSIITKFGLTMGGLLSGGPWQIEPYGSGPGVAFDALELSATVPSPPIGATLNGLTLGPIGTLIGMGNQIAKSIAVTPPNAQIAASEAPADADAAPAEDATPVDATSVEDLAPVEVTIATPPAASGAGPTRRGGHDGGIRAGRGAAQPAAAATADDAPKASAGKGRASR